ncbi:YidB family protein [Thermithiobacillus tepidarius DSM 3134]|uniref:YidB family protein n=1 Tax=Thermithiobacillus tepidarius TaxID=929 RepID=UPI00041E6565|nr:YidB family protein [Thermithiobacillus tepidarius]
MGLFDALIQEVSAGREAGGDGRARLLGDVFNMLTNPSTGGLPGLIRQFHERGFGELIDSWVGTGAKLPVTPDQLAQVLGSDRIDQLAQHAGLSDVDTARILAEELPRLVDKLTPDGTVPSHDMLRQGFELLKGKLG